MIVASALYSALLNPESHFKALSKLHFNGYAQDIVQVGDFLEAQITIEHQRYMLYLPCTELSSAQQELFAAVNSPLFEPYTVLRNELILKHNHNSTKCHDVIIQPLPEATPLSDSSLDPATRQTMIDSLEEECRRLKLNNLTLTERDILVDSDGLLHIIRYHNITALGTKHTFESLRKRFEANSVLNDAIAQYSASANDNLYHCDNYVLYEKGDRYGYVDSNGHSIITAKYIKAEEFFEGRAVVQTENGFGVIDTQGRLIIEDYYDNIKYDIDRSRFIAYFDGGKYVTFDHNGTRIPNEPISPIPKWQ